MIKKKLFKYGSVFMCAALMACSFTACGTNTSSAVQNEVAANEQDTDTETMIADVLTSQLSSAPKVATEAKTDSKEETVFVFTKADGQQDHVIVNEKLKNVTGKSSITDVSSLSNITNLTGDETSTTNGNNLTWAADGNSITYQGTTTQTAPVSMKVTYYLDGKEISASDLAGKSGKVTMRFDYTNNAKKTITVNGKTKTVYVPFTMVTGMLLPSDKFSNIEVTNGKITEVNDSNVVFGITMPGLKDSLDMKFDNEKLDLDVPEYFEVTADVTNIGQMDGTQTVLVYVKAEREGTPNPQLKGIAKAALKKGETKTVHIMLPDEAFGLCDDDGVKRVHQGSYTIYIGEKAAGTVVKD